MKQVTFKINKEIFEAVPGYRRAIIIASGIDNTKPVPQLGNEVAEITDMVRATITNEDHRIVAWREAFKSIGIKPRDFRPSIDALIRRIVSGKPLGSINPLVDIGTVISLKYTLPAGAHPLLDDTREVVLRFAHKGEFRVSEDNKTVEVPEEEVILVDTGRVATRRWVWRQTESSRITPTTRNLYFNIDALECIDEATLQAAIKDTQDLLRTAFKVNSQVVVLDPTHPKQIVEFA